MKKKNRRKVLKRDRFTMEKEKGLLVGPRSGKGERQIVSWFFFLGERKGKKGGE